ncbi:S1C family serine protease [Halonotius roseus]|uniref:Trypsin-like serine protease n=1 Tax=Halonotius roseus TaxID=2511997 RepID=A0A544QN24_9EURY|nr:trypsin-like peptidase domain-containing protein [Halonotius roseus]TQQ80313.1 trypsin-like serine protease [Halonotius roseus]
MEQTRRALLASVATGAAAVAGCAAPESTDSSAGESPYTRVYNEVLPSVVVVHVAENGRKVGQGSGFAIDPRTIVTNHHVVDPGSEVTVRLADGEWADASVVGSDRHSDLAVLAVDSSVSVSETLSFVAEPTPVGAEVVAIGAPFGLSESLSRGIVSARGRSVQGLSRFSIPAAIQTDTEVNSGSSGGPLVDLAGDVAGVVFASQGGNVGFAVSAELATRVIPELRETGSYDHSYLGVTIITVEPQIADANGLDRPRGVLVVETTDGGPSDGVLRPSLTDSDDADSDVDDGDNEEPPANGTEPTPPSPDEPAPEQPQSGSPAIPTGGDVILAIGGSEIDNTDELSRVLALETRPGQTVPIRVLRDGEEIVVDVTLGTLPDA